MNIVATNDYLNKKKFFVTLVMLNFTVQNITWHFDHMEMQESDVTYL